MSARRLLLTSLVCLVSCAPKNINGPNMGGIMVMPMKASVFVRATFDWGARRRARRPYLLSH